MAYTHCIITFMKMCMQNARIEHHQAEVVQEQGEQVSLNWVHDSASVHNRDMFYHCDSICCLRNRWNNKKWYIFHEKLLFIHWKLEFHLCSVNVCTKYTRNEAHGFAFALPPAIAPALSVAFSFVEALSSVDSRICCNLENCVNKFLVISVQHHYIKITANVPCKRFRMQNMLVWANILTNVIHSNSYISSHSIWYRYWNKKP